MTGGNCRSRQGTGEPADKGAGAVFSALVASRPRAADVLLVARA